MNSGLSKVDVTSDVTTADTHFHAPDVVESAEKLDSGIGSECSNRNRHVIKTRDNKPEVQEMECLLTARGLSVFVYEHSPKGEARTHLVPVVRVSLIQPSFNCTRRTDSDTIQISCFDMSLAQSNTKSAGECSCCFVCSTQPETRRLQQVSYHEADIRMRSHRLLRLDDNKSVTRQKIMTCSRLLKTGCNNIVLPILFIVVNNIVQHC